MQPYGADYLHPDPVLETKILAQLIDYQFSKQDVKRILLPAAIRSHREVVAWILAQLPMAAISTPVPLQGQDILAQVLARLSMSTIPTGLRVKIYGEVLERASFAMAEQLLQAGLSLEGESLYHRLWEGRCHSPDWTAIFAWYIDHLPVPILWLDEYAALSYLTKHPHAFYRALRHLTDPPRELWELTVEAMLLPRASPDQADWAPQILIRVNTERRAQIGRALGAALPRDLVGYVLAGA